MNHTFARTHHTHMHAAFNFTAGGHAGPGPGPDRNQAGSPRQPAQPPDSQSAASRPQPADQACCWCGLAQLQLSRRRAHGHALPNRAAGQLRRMCGCAGAACGRRIPISPTWPGPRRARHLQEESKREAGPLYTRRHVAMCQSFVHFASSALHPARIHSFSLREVNLD